MENTSTTAAAAATSARAATAATAYAASLPFPALPALPPRPSQAMISLAGRVAVRSATLRPGRTISTARPTNLEALLGQLTGQVNTPGCTHCAGGSGAWSACVSVPGFFGQSCANCHYGSEGRRCSLRPANIASAARVAAAVAAAMAAPAPAPAPAAVAQVAPHNPLRRSSAASRRTGRVRKAPLSASQRARRFAELHRGLAALYEEEARVLEDEEEEEDEEMEEGGEEGEEEEEEEEL